MHITTTKNIILSLITALFLSGCAGTPVKRESLPVYNINGKSYLSLVSLCQAKAIGFEYDAISRTATLNREGHRISVMAGDNLVLVDENPVHLKDPVDVYQGALVVPYKFKEQVLDVLFKETPSVARQRRPPLAIRKIVIDAGHGGEDPGTLGRGGLREKDVNLDIAKRLYNILTEDGYSVVMTRSANVFVSLQRRVQVANNSRADLFISIHSNANRVRSLNGLEVYCIAGGNNDYKRAASAAERDAPCADRDCIANPSLNLRATLWDMVYTKNRSQSLELARQICRSINTELDTRVIGIKSANFYVLKGTAMPGLLVEVGFLSNPAEERKMRNSSYRQQIALAIADAVADYAGKETLLEARR